MTPVILLFLAGIVLLFSELFVPGIIMGITGGVLVIASIALGWQRFPEYGLFILTGEVTGVIVILALGLFLLAKTRLGHGFILKSKQGASDGYANFAQDPTMVGAVVTVRTALRPAGSIMMGSQRIDAVSNGTFIDAGKSVRIIRVEGNRVVCEEASSDTSGKIAR